MGMSICVPKNSFGGNPYYHYRDVKRYAIDDILYSFGAIMVLSLGSISFAGTKKYEDIPPESSSDLIIVSQGLLRLAEFHQMEFIISIQAVRLQYGSRLMLQAELILEKLKSSTTNVLIVMIKYG